MNQAQDQKFFRNYALVIGVLVVMILAFFALAQMIGTDEEADLEQRAEVVAQRTAPVGQVRIAGQTEAAAPVTPAPTAGTGTPAAAAAGTGPQATAAAETAAAGAEETGKRVYTSLCFTCHGSIEGAGGLPNIPHFADKEAWAPRIAQGMPMLYEHAIKGFTGASGIPMLPKGGNPSLSDDEVRAAVDFIVANSQ
jgi:cytochrome c5